MKKLVVVKQMDKIYRTTFKLCTIYTFLALSFNIAL